jgi:hypothetical protein
LKVESGVKDNAEALSCLRFAECGNNGKKKRINTEFTEEHRGHRGERGERELRLAREDFGAWLTSIHGMRG